MEGIVDVVDVVEVVAVVIVVEAEPLEEMVLSDVGVLALAFVLRLLLLSFLLPLWLPSG